MCSSDIECYSTVVVMEDIANFVLYLGDLNKGDIYNNKTLFFYHFEYCI